MWLPRILGRLHRPILTVAHGDAMEDVAAGARHSRLHLILSFGLRGHPSADGANQSSMPTICTSRHAYLQLPPKLPFQLLHITHKLANSLGTSLPSSDTEVHRATLLAAGSQIIEAVPKPVNTIDRKILCIHQPGGTPDMRQSQTYPSNE